MPDWSKSKHYGHGQQVPEPQQGLKLPTGEQAADIMRDHGIDQLAKDGWAYLVAEHFLLASMISLLQERDHVNMDQVTGMSWIIGLMLQTPKGNDNDDMPST